MSRLLVAQRALTVPGWAKDALWRRAQAIPSLDLRFADNKSLVDATTGSNLVTFTRASSGTFVGSDGVLQTAVTDAPRFDHNPTTGESLGLLVEEQRTNSITNNTMVGAVAGTPGTNPTNWLFVSVPTGITREIIGVGTESGINYIDFRFSGTTVNANGIAIAPGNGAALTGQTWNASTYWKLTGGSTAGVSAFNLGIIEETSGGVFITGAFYGQTAPTSASLISQRPTATRTLTGGATVAQVRHTISLSIPTSTAIDFTIRIGLPQLEQGAFATSVISTSTAAATRSADVASITGSAFSSWYRQSEGTWFAQHDVRNAILSANNNTFSERQPQMALGAGMLHDFYSITGGAIQANSIGAAHVTGTPDRVVYALKANDFIGALNGTLFGADTSGSFGSLITQLNIGSLHNGASASNGTIRRLAFWGQRLPNNVLQQITQ